MADFAEIKEKVSLEQAAHMLGLKLTERNNQLRGPCPRCEAGGDRALALTPSKRCFYCFNSTAGGSVIDLVAHIRNVDLKHAADELAERFLDRKAATAPPAPQKHGEKQEGGLKPLDYLEADHPAVAAVGFDIETAQALGIGFAGRGMMKGLVAVPIRLEDGSLAGYLGITEAKLPPKFHLGNVVPFAKKSA